MTKREYLEEVSLLLIREMYRKGHGLGDIDYYRDSIINLADNIYNSIDEQCMTKLNNPPINIPSNSLSSGTFSDD